MGKLAGKIALITGGSSGMGLETARLFAAEGAKVIITGRRQDELDAAVKSIGSAATAVQGDVARMADLDRLFSVILEKHGRIDIVFANAGIAETASLAAADEAHFDRLFDVNVKGLFFTVQKSLSLLCNGGSVILNASVAASRGMEDFSVYSATKAAVRSFARGWAADLKQRKIRVNVISPGPIETPIFGKMGMTDAEIKGFADHLAAHIPLGRMGRSEEIAKAVLFLASDDSSYINGIELLVDGGMAQV